VQAASIDEYDNSVFETIRLGRRFEYCVKTTLAPRVGYFHRASGRFVGLRTDERVVYTHYVVTEAYVRGLPNSTYR
jgi:hypothetical protein